jgi:hypothetical protein
MNFASSTHYDCGLAYCPRHQKSKVIKFQEIDKNCGTIKILKSSHWGGERGSAKKIYLSFCTFPGHAEKIGSGINVDTFQILFTINGKMIIRISSTLCFDYVRMD